MLHNISSLQRFLLLDETERPFECLELLVSRRANLSHCREGGAD